ncbi:MAG: metallophosphoesterase [Opitutaceae bacterium]|nr:metallophosphoesterase [Opitutaceae bacterium]
MVSSLFQLLIRKRSWNLLLVATVLAGAGTDVRAHGDLHERIADLRTALADSPTDPALGFKLADLLLAHGEWRAALDQVDQVERLAPASFPIDFLRGSAWLRGGEPGRALEALDRFCRKNPTSPNALALRARAKSQLGKPREALADYLESLRHTSRPDPDVLVDASTVAEQAGDLAKALELVREGLTMLGRVPALVARADHLVEVMGKEPRPVTHAAQADGIQDSNTKFDARTKPPEPSSGTLQRGPYLQMAAPTEITVRWRSEKESQGRVRFGTSPDVLDGLVEEPVARRDHVVTLRGLKPGTTYYYSVGSGTEVLAGDANTQFTTPPVTGTRQPVRIWALGDAGTANKGQRAVRDSFARWSGERFPDLVLQLGDNAYDDGLDSEFQVAMFDVYGDFLKRVPFWSCLGNHETSQETAFIDTYPYFSIYTFPTAGECGGVPSGTEHYFSFDHGNVHIISLDSMTASRSPRGAMALWLREDLAATTADWVICIFHHPVYTKGSHDSDTERELIEMRRTFAPILEAGGVDLVLNGHSHSYERSYLLNGHYGLSNTMQPAMKLDPGDGRVTGDGAYRKPATGPRGNRGTVYSVAGSAGKISGGSLNHPAHVVSLNRLGSLVIDIEGLRLDGTFLRENGEVDDIFRIEKR